MALTFLYRLVRRVVELVRIHRMDAVANDAEILKGQNIGSVESPCRPLRVIRQMVRPTRGLAA